MTSIGPRVDARLRRSRMLGILSFVLVLGVAFTVTILLGRRPGPAVTSGHDHAASSPSGEARQPVRLTPEAARRIGVTFAAVMLGPIDREIRTVAQVAFDETRVSIVAPKVEGWVERLHVNATGQPVRRGQPLFDMYSPMVLTAQQELLLAKGLAGRLTGASEDTRSGAASLVDAARHRLLAWDVPQAQIEAIERNAEVRRTVTLTAPVSGIVVEKTVLEGQRLMAGEPAYRIADLSRVWLEGEVFERDLATVRTGQPLTAEFAALPGVVRPGRIAYVYPTLDPTTRTARVRVELANPDLRLKPGMYATLRFTPRTAPR